jgi:hypothetical protein
LTEVYVRKFTYLFVGLLLAGSIAQGPWLGPLSALGAGSAALGAAPAKDVKTFVGTIGDSMCGAKHMMAGESDKDCTLECVKAGAKYILIDPKGKIYQLSDQKKPEPFAGAKVKVTGTLTGDTIMVSSITAAD